MVYEASVAAHAMPIDNQTTVQIQAIVMRVQHVHSGHSILELAFRHHLANILENVNPLPDGLLRPDAPSLVLRHKAFDARRHDMPLDVRVAAFVRTWTRFG